MLYQKIYSAPPWNEREMLRYAGCRKAGEADTALARSCMEEAEECLSYKVCYTVCELVSENNDICDFGAFSVVSKNLAKNLSGCGSVLVFGATVGIALDRLIAKYARLSPARALMMQALGAERIEALCDAFCADFEKENGVALRPRFSPGYGDVPLTVQKDIFTLLDLPRKIGISLNDSLLMSPTKSVTAFAGITDSKK